MRWKRYKNVNPPLINEVAEEIARLENLITVEEQVLSNLEVSRDGVEKAVTATAQRIAQFTAMEVVKATEAMQRTTGCNNLYRWRIFQRFDSGRILKTPANASGRTSGSPDAAAQLRKSQTVATLTKSWRKPELAVAIKVAPRMY